MHTWNERFSDNPYFYGKMPNDFVVSSVGYIPKGKVLCLAEGEGRNAIFLARSGYEVTGVDISDVGIENARKLAQDSKVEANFICEDLASFDIGEDQWDGIISIFCHLPKTLRKEVHKNVVKGLKKGGALILEGYSPAQLAFGTGGPKDIDLLMSWDDLKVEFEGLEFITGHQTERIIFEGLAHNGPGSVTQIIGIKK